jgi:ribose transport system substrate-binding protein
MKSIEKTALVLLALAVAFTSGCGERHSKKEVFYLIGANMKLSYWQTAADGFNRAAAQYQVTAKVEGPDTYDAQRPAF